MNALLFPQTTPDLVGHQDRITMSVGLLVRSLMREKGVSDQWLSAETGLPVHVVRSIAEGELDCSLFTLTNVLLKLGHTMQVEAYAL